MARRLLLIGPLLSGLAAAALVWAAPDDKPQPPLPSPVAEKAEPSLIERLDRRIDFPGVDDPKATLRDALDQLTKASGLAFDVNEVAFRDDMIDQDVLAQQVGDRPIPKMTNVPAERVLRKLLARAGGGVPLAFLVRREAVEITTARALAAEVWPKDYEGPHLPLVNVVFDHKPLGEALKELARQSGMNVVLDARLAEKAKTPVSARLLNAPLDTAVRLLADMAELKPFLVDNLLYVSTRDNADKLAEQERRRSARDPELAPRVGNGPRAAPAGLPGGM